MKIKKEVRARNKKKKRKTLSERNSDLKLTSAATAAQVVNYGQVDVEALAAAGKGKLMTVAERVQLVLILPPLLGHTLHLRSPSKITSQNL